MNAHIGSYENTIKAEAKARRIRLMGITKPKAVEFETVVALVPEWKCIGTDFSAHVLAFAQWTEAMKKYEEDFVEIPERPTWQWKFSTFSQHIVDFYQFKKAVYDRQKQLDDIMPAYMRRPLPDILQEVKSLIGCEVSDDEIRGASRMRYCVEPRQYAFWAMRRLRPDMSYPQIGRFFGSRDHTTVLHGERKIEALIKSGRSKLIYDGHAIRKA